MGGCMRTRLTAATSVSSSPLQHEISLELVTQNDVRVNFHQSSFAHHDHELHDFHVDCLYIVRSCFKDIFINLVVIVWICKHNVHDQSMHA